MSFLDIFRKTPVAETEERSFYDDNGIALNYSTLGCNYKTSLSLTLSSVYRAVECISNTIASLPVNLYEVNDKGFKTLVNSPLAFALSKEPNKKMSAYTFYKLLVRDILLTGNAYALIRRENNVVVGLDYIMSGLVNPIDKGTEIQYQVAGKKETIKSSDICHFLNYSENGVCGISVLTHARRTLGIADFGEKSAENFFKTGGCVSGFLKFTGPSNGKQKEEILQSWNSANSSVNGGPNGIAVLPTNVDFHQLSVNPADAQLLESRKFSVIEVARFFSIPPSKLFDNTKSSYASEESNNLQYLNDCIRPLITKIEHELERKLFPNNIDYDIRFDVGELLRTDKKSQAEYFTKLFNLGVLSPNEIRRQLDMNELEDGDIHVAQINLTSIKNLETINATSNVDNRLKEEDKPEQEDTQNKQEDDDKETEQE